MREVEPFEQETFKRLAGVGGGASDALLREMNWRNCAFKGYTMDQLERLGDPKTAVAGAEAMGYTSLAERHERDKAQHLFGRRTRSSTRSRSSRRCIRHSRR